jgi:AcrR family transcriptional regulator
VLKSTHHERNEVILINHHQAIMDRMQSQLSSWKEAGDSRAVFLECYSMMTDNMIQAIQAGEFHDAQWVEQLLVHFASFYFHALDVYQQDSFQSPAVWRLTFDRAQNHRLHAIQNLLLGVNAHINYDLVMALGDMLEPDWGQLDEAMRRQRHEDHTHVNQVISRTLDAAQDSIIEPREPAMDIIDRLLGPLDEWLISSLIERWREGVWEQAVLRIEQASQDEREHLRREVENDCLQRAGRILLEDL